jgi:hypothetical protein
LHFVDNFGGPVYVFFFACDYHIGLAGGNLDAEGLAQKTKVAVSGPEQLKLFVD